MVFLELWSWILMLDYQEWFLLLGAGAIFGFFCMRGFGSSNRV